MMSRIAQWLSGQGVRRKLIAATVATCGAGLSILAVSVTTASLVEQRQQMVSSLSTTVEMLSLNSQAALAFQDTETATEVLSALSQDEQILRARILLPDGSEFARFLRPDADLEFSPESDDDPWDTAAQAGPDTQFKAGRLLIRSPIRVGDRVLGTLVVDAALTRLTRSLTRQLLTAASLLIVSIAVAFGLANTLLKRLTRPIVSLSEAMTQVSQERDYAVRLNRESDDEIGTLFDGFNEMLEQIGNRDSALKEAIGLAEKASQAKSDFLATMSHEIRTPLNGVLGMADLLSQSELDVRQRRFAAIIQHSATALLDIINDILDFSKIEAGKLELERARFDLVELIAGLADGFGLAAKERGIELIVDFPRIDPIWVLGDSVRLKQVLNNLVSNAIKFTERGHVRLRIRSLPESNDWRFEIIDTGIGIEATQQSRILEAFTQADGSTTRRYGGTGLGLAISRRLVELMDGTLTVSSFPGDGSNFSFAIPLEQCRSSLGPRDNYSPLVGQVAHVSLADQTLGRSVAEVLREVGLKVEASTILEEFSTANCEREWPDFLVVDTQSEATDNAHLNDVLDQYEGLQVLVLTPPGVDLGGILPRHLSRVRSMQKPALARPLAEELLVLSQEAGVESKSQGVSTEDTEAKTSMLRGVRVLLAEDNPVNQEVACEILEALGMVVTRADDGEQALDALRTHSFQAVLMDCQMPRIDGLEATRRWRAIEEKRELDPTPIIALTANAVSGDRERCIDAGMDGYLSKPVTYEQLRDCLLEHCPTDTALS